MLKALGKHGFICNFRLSALVFTGAVEGWAS